jgi:hypothetical protein
MIRITDDGPGMMVNAAPGSAGRLVGGRPAAGLLLAAGIVLGCDDTQLSPVTDFEAEDCEDPSAPECREGGPRVPVGGGGGGGADGGISGGLDLGLADAGAPDLGPPDLGPAPSEFLDLNGTWQTEYVFDVSSYLFGISRIGGGLDFVDQALQGNIDLGNAVLNRIVRPLLEPFFRQVASTPNGMRLQTVISTLNQIAHLFREIQARGEMTIVQDPPADPFADTVRLRATERWDALEIFLIASCPDGRQTTSPPHPQPYPDCGRTPVPIQNVPTPIMTGSGDVDVQVYVEPFEGELQAGVPAADFVFRERAVEIEITKLILLAIDLSIRVASGGQYQGMEDLFRNTVCVDVANEAERLALQFGATRPFATLARQTAQQECVRLLVDELTRQTVGQLGVDWDAFEFDQLGRAVDRTGDRHPEVLQTHRTAASIRGRFRFVAGTSLEGTWASP